MSKKSRLSVRAVVAESNARALEAQNKELQVRVAAMAAAPPPPPPPPPAAPPPPPPPSPEQAALAQYEHLQQVNPYAASAFLLNNAAAVASAKAARRASPAASVATVAATAPPAPPFAAPAAPAPPPSVASVDHKANYESLRATNPYLAQEYLVNHRHEIYPGLAQPLRAAR